MMIKNHLLKKIVGYTFLSLSVFFNSNALSQVNAQSGWNLFGNGSTNPLDPSALGTKSQITSIWKWDAKNSKWSFYSPQQSDGGQAYATTQNYEFLTNINPNDGFWVNALQPFSFSTNTPGVSSEVFNAISSFGLTNSTTSSSSLSSLLSGAVIVHSAIINVNITNQSGKSGNISLLNNELSYLKSDGTTYHICINSAWIDTVNTNNQGNNCSDSGITKVGTWSIPNGSTNSFVTKSSSTSNFADTVTMLTPNLNQGVYFENEPYPYTSSPDNTSVNFYNGFGSYSLLSPAFSTKTLAGNTVYVYGQSDCSNGVASVVFSSDGTTATRTCKSGRSDGSSDTPIFWQLSNSTVIPGILVGITSKGITAYLGVTVGSTFSSGNIVVINTGNNQCGTGTGHSLSNCGNISIQAYSN